MAVQACREPMRGQQPQYSNDPPYYGQVQRQPCVAPCCAPHPDYALHPHYGPVQSWQHTPAPHHAPHPRYGPVQSWPSATPYPVYQAPAQQQLPAQQQVHAPQQALAPRQTPAPQRASDSHDGLFNLWLRPSLQFTINRPQTSKDNIGELYVTANGAKTALKHIWAVDKESTPSSQFKIPPLYRFFRIWSSYYIEEPRGPGLYLTDPHTGRRSELIGESYLLMRVLWACWGTGAKEVILSFPPPDRSVPGPIKPPPNRRTRNGDEVSQDHKRRRVTEPSKPETHKHQRVTAEVSGSNAPNLPSIPARTVMHSSKGEHSRVQPAASASGTVHRERKDSRAVSAAVSAPTPKEKTAAQLLDAIQSQTSKKHSVDQSRLIQDDSPLIRTSEMQDSAGTKRHTTPRRPTPSPITSPTPSSSLGKDASKLIAAVQAVSSPGSGSITSV